MDSITYRPIGIISTPFKNKAGMPIQPSGAIGVRGTIKISADYIAGLKDLEGFSHIIGFSVVKLNAVKGVILDIENVDIIDGTPLLDIKPYVPKFDAQVKVETGWLGKVEKRVHKTKSDLRFT